MPAARTASATPATSGASGPTTTRSTPSDCASAATAAPSSWSTSCSVATAAMPGLPGAACTSVTCGSRDSARARACSRPPVPMTSVFTCRAYLSAVLRAGRGRTIVCSRSGPTPIVEIRAPDIFSSASDVVLRRLRKVVERTRLGDVLGPAGEELVDRLGVVEAGLRHRHLVDPLAVDVVRDAHRDLVPAGQHVELGEHEVGDAVDACGVAGDRGVVPAAASGAAGRGAELGAVLAQLLAVVVEQLGRERALADAGGVRLDDADDAGDLGRRDARAGAGAAGRRRRRGHERVGAVVDVEQRRLAGLEQHGLVGGERLVQQQRGVGDHRAEPVDVRQQLLDDLVDLDGATVVDLGEDLVLELECALDLLRAGSSRRTGPGCGCRDGSSCRRTWGRCRDRSCRSCGCRGTARRPCRSCGCSRR